MILIIGGAYQGKLAFAREKYPDTAWIDGQDCEEEELYRCGGIFHFHSYVERMMKEGKGVEDLAEDIIRRNPDICIVSDEIGYGIVPVSRFERDYREMTGRICTKLAGEASKVYRVVCGIGMVVKE